MEGLWIAPVIALTIMRQVRHEYSHMQPGQPVGSTVAQLGSLQKKRRIQRFAAGGMEKVIVANNVTTVGPYC